MMPRQASPVSPDVTRWAPALWTALSWEQTQRVRLEACGWLLAWASHVSAGDPTCQTHALSSARYGLLGCYLPSHKAALTRGVLGQIEIAMKALRDLTGEGRQAHSGPALVLALACSPWAAQRWISARGDSPHIEEAAREIAQLEPRAQAYAAWVATWLDAGAQTERVVIEAIPCVVAWRTHKGKRGVLHLPASRVAVDAPHRLTAHRIDGTELVAALPPVSFALGRERRDPPGPTVEDAARRLLEVAPSLPLREAAALARALGMDGSHWARAGAGG